MAWPTEIYKPAASGRRALAELQDSGYGSHHKVLLDGQPATEFTANAADPLEKTPRPKKERRCGFRISWCPDTYGYGPFCKHPHQTVACSSERS
jgi:hypothetical protein